MVKPLFQVCASSLLALLSLWGVNVSATAQESLNGQFATEKISVTLQADQVQNYGRLLEQAVTTANGVISTTFANNLNADPIELTVLINRNGQLLPLLMAAVSRDQWQQQPNVQNWARYSDSVRILLGYAQPPEVARREARQRSLSAFLEREALIDELD